MPLTFYSSFHGSLPTLNQNRLVVSRVLLPGARRLDGLTHVHRVVDGESVLAGGVNSQGHPITRTVESL